MGILVLHGLAIYIYTYTYIYIYRYVYIYIRFQILYIILVGGFNHLEKILKSMGRIN